MIIMVQLYRLTLWKKGIKIICESQGYTTSNLDAMVRGDVVSGWNLHWDFNDSVMVQRQSLSEWGVSAKSLRKWTSPEKTQRLIGMEHMRMSRMYSQHNRVPQRTQTEINILITSIFAASLSFVEQEFWKASTRDGPSPTDILELKFVIIGSLNQPEPICFCILGLQKCSSKLFIVLVSLCQLDTG